MASKEDFSSAFCQQPSKLQHTHNRLLKQDGYYIKTPKTTTPPSGHIEVVSVLRCKMKIFYVYWVNSLQNSNLYITRFSNKHRCNIKTYKKTYSCPQPMAWQWASLSQSRKISSSKGYNPLKLKHIFKELSNKHGCNH